MEITLSTSIEISQLKITYKTCIQRAISERNIQIFEIRKKTKKKHKKIRKVHPEQAPCSHTRILFQNAPIRVHDPLDYNAINATNEIRKKTAARASIRYTSYIHEKLKY